jgi:ribonuclease Z
MSARRRIPEILSALVMLGMLLATISQIHAQTRDTGASRNTILPIVQASAPAVPSTADFRVTLLGTATPAPRPDRFGPSTLVEAGSERLVFDCGRSCTTRLWQLKIPLGSVKLFITHLHSDHTVGIPDLWLTGWLSPPYGGRKEPFKVFGPKGTEEMMSYLEKAYQSDIRIRREEDHAMSTQGVAVAAKDFTEGVVYEENGVRVTAFKVHHGIVNKEAFGFRVDYKGHSVVISGDTGPTENFVKYAQGADVVVHEVGVARPELLEKASWARNIMTFHSSPEDAGKEFSRIKPKLAVYTHFVMLSGEGVSEVTIPEIITRTRATYAGPLEAGEDLMSISVGDTVTVQRNPH